MRKDTVWENRGQGYIETTNPSGYDVLINGSDKYLNFNLLSGVTGYGFRDNAGVMEFKNFNGLWEVIPNANNLTNYILKSEPGSLEQSVANNYDIRLDPSGDGYYYKVSSINESLEYFYADNFTQPNEGGSGGTTVRIADGAMVLNQQGDFILKNGFTGNNQVIIDKYQNQIFNASDFTVNSLSNLLLVNESNSSSIALYNSGRIEIISNGGDDVFIKTTTSNNNITVESSGRISINATNSHGTHFNTSLYIDDLSAPQALLYAGVDGKIQKGNDFSGTPTSVAGTGAGTTPTITVSGNEVSHRVTVITGTSPAGSNATVTTISNPSTISGKPVFSPANKEAAELSGATSISMDTGGGGYLIKSGTTALAASTTYQWNVHFSVNAI